MIKRLTAHTIIWCFTISAFANNDTTHKYQSQPEEETVILNKIDSLTALLLANNTSYFIDTGYVSGVDPSEYPTFPDSVYRQRIASLSAHSPVPLVYNEIVKRYIELFAIQKKDQFEKVLGLTQVYFPMIESHLDKHGLPLELKYLPVIESALNAHARSWAGATGLWQFMYPTAKMYGLNITSYLDERCDPRLSTEAAISFLNDLYKLYGDWPMALAAYNCGPGNVNKAIRRSGGKMSYWAIRDYLPRETRGYVPAYIAATYIMNFYKEHHLIPQTADLFLMPTDTVHIYEQTSIRQIAHFTELSGEIVKFLNPVVKKDLIPASETGFCLTLPVEAVGNFIDFQDSIFAASKKELPDNYVSGTMAYAKSYDKNSGSAASTRYTPDTDGKTKLYYQIKSGDNLGYIAMWYDCNVRELKLWNGLSGNNIRAGQKLVVYVPTADLIRYKDINDLSFSQKQARIGKNTASTDQPSYQPTPGGNYMEYTIKKGDTLWELSKTYPKNSVEKIRQINNITDLSEIKPGKVIKLEI